MPGSINHFEIPYNEIFSGALQIILIIIANFLLYKFLIFLIKKLLAKGSDGKHTRSETLITLIASTIKYIFYFAVFSQILDVFGVSIMSILAVAGVSSIAIGFGAQSLVRDVISGIFILFEDQFNIGDIVSIDDKTGTVETIGIRITRLRGLDGFVHIIPNGEIKVVTNMTKEYACAIIDMQICYSDNTDRAIEIIKNETEKIIEHFSFILEPPNILGVVSMDEGIVIIRIVAKCEIGKNFEAERELRRVIKRRLENEGFSPPYKKIALDKTI